MQVVFDDFESTVPKKIDDNNVPLGFITFTDGQDIDFFVDKIDEWNRRHSL